MKEKKRDGEGGGKPRGSRKNIVGRCVCTLELGALLCSLSVLLVLGAAALGLLALTGLFSRADLVDPWL